MPRGPTAAEQKPRVPVCPLGFLDGSDWEFASLTNLPEGMCLLRNLKPTQMPLIKMANGKIIKLHLRVYTISI